MVTAFMRAVELLNGGYHPLDLRRRQFRVNGQGQRLAAGALGVGAIGTSNPMPSEAGLTVQRHGVIHFRWQCRAPSGRLHQLIPAGDADLIQVIDVPPPAACAPCPAEQQSRPSAPARPGLPEEFVVQRGGVALTGCRPAFESRGTWRCGMAACRSIHAGSCRSYGLVVVLPGGDRDSRNSAWRGRPGPGRLPDTPCRYRPRRRDCLEGKNEKQPKCPIEPARWPVKIALRWLAGIFGDVQIVPAGNLRDGIHPRPICPHR